MASAPTYCTHKELKRVFPQLDEFDQKQPVYGWTLGLLNWFETSLDLYYAHNTGLVTELYIDGIKCSKKTFPSETTQVATQMGRDTSDLIVDAHSGISAGDIIKVGSEYMTVTGVTTGTNTISVASAGGNRGLFGTASVIHPVDESVYLVYDVSADSPDASAGSPTALKFVYDSDLDFCLLNTEDLNPADYLVESGESFTSMVTQYRGDASRLLDSLLDPNLSREQLKDKSGNYDYLIIRSAALICASIMIKTNDPTSEMANAYMEEAMGYVDKLNNGEAALSYQNTADSSKGLVRDVTYTGTVRPVDTRGHYSGTYDLIKVKITTGGAIGTAKYSVWVKDGDKLGMNEGNQVVTDEIVNGDYQSLAGGLQIRFQGTNFDSTAAVNDVWEVEVMGWSEEVDSSSLQPIRMTRKWQ